MIQDNTNEDVANLIMRFRGKLDGGRKTKKSRKTKKFTRKIM